MIDELDSSIVNATSNEREVSSNQNKSSGLITSEVNTMVKLADVETQRQEKQCRDKSLRQEI